MSSASARWRCRECGTFNTNRKICRCGQRFRYNGQKGKKGNGRKNGGQHN